MDSIKPADHVTDRKGKAHKVKGWDPDFNLYILYEVVGKDKAVRTLIGYDPEDGEFVQIMHNLETGIAIRNKGIEPFDPHIYSQWEDHPPDQPKPV